MAINYNETLRADVVTASGSSASNVVSGKTDIKVRDRKIYDTSSSADAFSSLSAGDDIKISGFDQDENNGICNVTEVETNGEWIKVTKHLVDVAEANIPSAGITIDEDGEILTVNSEMTSKDYVNDVVNFNTASSSPEDMTKANFGVNNDGKVASFATLDAGDTLMVLWSDTDKG